MAKKRKKSFSRGVPVVAQMRGSQVWVWVKGALIVFERPLVNVITKYVARKMGVPQSQVRPWVVAAIRAARAAVSRRGSSKSKKISSFKGSKSIRMGKSAVRYRVLRR